MGRPKAAVNRLEAAQAALEGANRQLADMEAKRNAALLRDDDVAAAKLAAEIEQQQRLVRGHADKIKLLQAEAEKEANERRVKEKEALIKRIEVKFAERDRLGAELQDLVPQADKLLRRMLELGRDIAAAWGWQNSEIGTCLLGREAIVNAVAHELFRITAVPMLGGGMDQGNLFAGYRFPGSKAPSFAHVGQPESVTALTDALRSAAEYGSAVMRGKAVVRPVTAAAPTPSMNGNGTTDAVAARVLTPAEARLTDLHRRQAEIASLSAPSPDQEREYSEIVKQIAIAQAQLETEKQANV